MSLRDRISAAYDRVVNSDAVVRRRAPDMPASTMAVFRAVQPYTMTSLERIGAVCDAVAYVTAAGIAGAYVECGVWRGGSSMAAALSLLARGATDRDLHLYDTFEGMSAPTEHDRKAADGASAAALLDASRTTEKIWCKAGIDDVDANMRSTGYPTARIHLHKGKVEDTLPAAAPERIAILRLDTDWYESTRHELETLYPRLTAGGVLIIDDYGYWAGARKAVDEYFADRPILLARTDHTGRMAVKLHD